MQTKIRKLFSAPPRCHAALAFIYIKTVNEKIQTDHDHNRTMVFMFYFVFIERVSSAMCRTIMSHKSNKDKSQ